MIFAMAAPNIEMNGKIVEANVAKLGSALKISVIIVGVHVEIPSFTTENRPIGISMNRAPEAIRSFMRGVSAA